MKTKVCVNGYRLTDNKLGHGYMEVEAFKWITIHGTRCVVHRSIHGKGFDVSYCGHRIGIQRMRRKDHAIVHARERVQHFLPKRWSAMGRKLAKTKAECLKFGKVVPHEPKP
jgi:hypothetical protein